MNIYNNDFFQTPCFIFDEAEFERGVVCFRNALVERFRHVEIGYSVKTNSLPYAMLMAKRYGCKAEVVSHDEYRLARLCGFDPCDIIYNGPMKSYETFIEAIIGGATVNIETKRELKWLTTLPEDRVYNVGLRLNINISRVSPEDADGDEDNSRFGFSDETTEFAEAVRYISSISRLRLSGLHIHRTAHSRLPRFYERSVGYAAQIIKKYNLDIDYLDVGGGYFGIFPNKPTFSEYADAIHTSLGRFGLDDLRVIIEPGNALVASPFAFLSEIIDVKKVDTFTRFVTTDGSRNDIDPFFHKTDYIKEILPKTSGQPIEPLQIITGCTCLEYDRLFTLKKQPRLKVGDRILYHNVGAYTMTLSPQFIRLWPRVYAIGKDGDIRKVRRNTCASDIISLDK
jgi:diaminopimelate decarboxylase